MGKIKKERKNKKQGKVILQKRKREGSEGHGNSEEKKKMKAMRVYQFRQKPHTLQGAHNWGFCPRNHSLF